MVTTVVHQVMPTVKTEDEGCQSESWIQAKSKCAMLCLSCGPSDHLLDLTKERPKQLLHSHMGFCCLKHMALPALRVCFDSCVAAFASV